MRSLLVFTLALGLTTTTAVATTNGTATAAVPGTASAATTASGADITVGPDGFSAPATVRAGFTAFRVTSTDPDGAYIGLVRLRPGVPLREYLGHLEKAHDGTDPGGALAAARAVHRDVVMYGGAAVLPGTPVTFTSRLRPGAYHVIDFKDVGSPGLADKVRPLRVLPAGTPRTPDRAAAQITQRETGEGPRFAVSGTLRAGAPVRVANHSRQYNEAILMPVRPGTTREQVGAFFTGMDGGPRASSPFIGGPVGTVPLSPGRSVTITAGLRPGSYALVTWLRDHDTGRLLAAQGMHEIVTVAG